MIAKATLAVGLTVASGVLSAAGSIAQGQQAAAAARSQAQLQEQQAAIQEQQAERERQVAAADEEELRMRNRRVLARQRALLGASGVEPAAGSPLFVAMDTAAEAELQALRIRDQGEVAATRLEQQAGLTRFDADITRASGRAAQRAGFTRAGAQLVGSGADAFGVSRRFE